MKQIHIGTCIPGTQAEAWLPHMVQAGFECAAINFHMSLEGTDLKEQAARVRDLLDGTGVYVSTLGYYCNPLMYEEHKETLKYVIRSAAAYGAANVGTFAGAFEGESVDAAMPKFKEVFTELAAVAEDEGVRLVIENCPMGGTWRHTTCNIGFNPKAWEQMFDLVPSEALGLEWEPGHQQIQLIDPIAQLREWAPKIYHMHGKDASVDMDAVRRYGVFGAVEFAPQRTPGFGDLNWRDIFSILRENGYEGDVCVEGYHDPIYRGDWEMTAQLHALQYLKWARGGEFVPNPWDQK
ncbi:MAG: sugar phosphate isomerase/epimerase [Clostridiales bacterium]|nr:sugar phosphate isomerase/epimerase [Clostridiales bacterium]